MSRRATVLAGTAVVCALSLAAPDDRGLARVVPRPEAVTGPFSDDVRVRRKYGLDATLAHIARVREARRAGTLRGAHTGFGALLTADEIAEIGERGRIADVDVPAIRAWAATRRSTFGGLYVDHEGGGRIAVLVTTSADDARRQLLRVVRHPERLSVREVRYSQRALRKVQDVLAASRDALLADGVELASTSNDVIRNVVEVTVVSDLDKARRVLPRYVPLDMIKVMRGAYLQLH